MRYIVFLCLVVLAGCTTRQVLDKSQIEKPASKTAEPVFHVAAVGSLNVQSGEDAPDQSTINKAIEYLKISQEENALPKRAEAYCPHGYSLVEHTKSGVSQNENNEWQAWSIFTIRCVGQSAVKEEKSPETS